jgi:hypothetical protein
MPIDIRPDRGDGKLKLFSDRRGVRALPPHPIQLGFLMVGHFLSPYKMMELYRVSGTKNPLSFLRGIIVFQLHIKRAPPRVKRGKKALGG